jgi:hypothetical protein
MIRIISTRAGYIWHYSTHDAEGLIFGERSMTYYTTEHQAYADCPYAGAIA